MSFLQAILRHWHPLPPCKSATQSGKHSPSDHGDHVGVVHLGGVHVHLGSDHLGGVHFPPSDPSSKACPCYQAKTTNPSTDDQSDNHGSPVTIAFLPTQPKFICHSIKCHTHMSAWCHILHSVSDQHDKSIPLVTYHLSHQVVIWWVLSLVVATSLGFLWPFWPFLAKVGSQGQLKRSVLPGNFPTCTDSSLRGGI